MSDWRLFEPKGGCYVQEKIVSVGISVLMTLAIVGLVARAQAQEKTEHPEAKAAASHHGAIFREVSVEKEKNLTVQKEVSQLGAAAFANGLQIVGYVNEGAEASEGAAKPIEARSLLVENPADAKKLLSEDPAASLAVPTRISVFERDGHIMIGYMPPSEFLKGLKSKDIHEMGVTMDREVRMTVESASR